MKAQLDQISVAAAQEIASASDKNSLEAVRIKYLGKKGALTAILRGMGALSAEERPVIGAYANTVRAQIEAMLEEKNASLASEELKNALVKEKLDVTMPAKVKTIGKLHPITQVENRMKEIFVGLGFDIVEGPEVESAYNNFDALNAPADHPSRDFQDTFYINDTTLLRTQTSPVQIRAMKSMEPPIRIISPGRVYRCDEVDATHSPMFHQLEGLVIDKNITLGDLKGLLELWAKEMFGSDTKTRFRPGSTPVPSLHAHADRRLPVSQRSGPAPPPSRPADSLRP